MDTKGHLSVSPLKIPVLTLLNEEQKDKHHVRGSVLTSALQSQEGA